MLIYAVHVRKKIVTSAKEVMFRRCLSVCLFVCLFVCLLATLRKNLRTDLHEIFRQWASERIRIVIRIRIRIPDRNRHQNLIVCSSAHCQPFLKISCKSVRKLLRKVANRQTDKQRRKLTSLAEVTTAVINYLKK